MILWATSTSTWARGTSARPRAGLAGWRILDARTKAGSSALARFLLRRTRSPSLGVSSQTPGRRGNIGGLLSSGRSLPGVGSVGPNVGLKPIQVGERQQILGEKGHPFGG